jgi:cytochrome c oxidase accessory protein FixG
MSKEPAIGGAPDRVLSTLNRDGSRRWLIPRLSPGRFLTARRITAYALIVVYNVLPWIRIGGKPSILLDLPRREFTFFGTTFLPTDTLLLMLFVAGVFVTVFLITALFGRLWCGWGCPQTVYMEFVYRPIERLFDGSPGARRRGKPGATSVRKVLKYVVFFLVSLHLAHTFLAYFVGPENLLGWTTRSPLEHPTAFLVVMAVTGLMMFDFCFFREQTCIVACPYGRFQSVMLDRNSLIISYDGQRGEPRGPMRRRAKTKENGDAAAATGDCIDCTLCVTTCPTGIDIRDGLQMECIGCAQCIDACDAVMEKIGRAKGLIRYSSQASMEAGKRRLLRPRVVLYPLLLVIIAVAFVTVLATKAPADVTLLRAGGAPYVRLENGDVSNSVRVKIVNRGEAPRRYRLAVEGLAGARIEGDAGPVELAAGETAILGATIVAPPEVFDLGRAIIRIVVTDDDGFSESTGYRLQGPWGSGSAAAREEAGP